LIDIVAAGSRGSSPEQQILRTSSTSTRLDDYLASAIDNARNL
jgi:hypothetical protein